MNNSKAAINMLPKSCDPSAPYVYLLWDRDEVVYVGQTFDIKTRIQAHLKDKDFNQISIIECTKEEIDEVENHNITTLKPKYNKKDNPNYKKPVEFIDDANVELATRVQVAADDMGISGVMALNKLCTELSYERVSKVWHGNTSAKFCDVEYVLSVLNITIRWSSK